MNGCRNAPPSGCKNVGRRKKVRAARLRLSITGTWKGKSHAKSTTAAVYWVVTPTSIFAFEFWRSAAQISQILTTQINVTTDLGRTAAEIEQIVTRQINVTIDFRPTAAEIEQIVTLIANIKRIYIFLFTFAINVTICSISAAVGQKSIVTLILMFTICSISAAVGIKLTVTLIFIIRFAVFRRSVPKPTIKLIFEAKV